jgi:hypothetical protein
MKKAWAMPTETGEPRREISEPYGFKESMLDAESMA